MDTIRSEAFPGLERYISRSVLLSSDFFFFFFGTDL